MAARCIDGEFDENAWLAASDPECIALGITYQSIEYHIGLINPPRRWPRTRGGSCAGRD